MRRIQSIQNNKTFDRLYDYLNTIISPFTEETSVTSDCTATFYNAAFRIGKVYSELPIFRGHFISTNE